MISLEGKVALITGASRGIGSAVAHSLAAQGVSLGLASRSGDDLGIERAVAAPCDVRRPRRPRVAGGRDRGALRRHRHPRRERRSRRVRAVPRPPARPARRDDRRQREGHALRRPRHVAVSPKSDAADIVTLASEAGRRGLPLEAVYCASKFAQVGFTRALDHELREQGIRCTNVCPGGVATDFAMGRGRTPEMPALEGMMAPEDVAEVVLFVLTRPRNHRILETAFRPVTEPSWG